MNREEPKQVLFKNNVYLTAFLDDCCVKIPTTLPEKDDDILQDSQAKLFLSYFRSHADTLVLTALETNKPFECLAVTLERYRSTLLNIQRLLLSCPAVQSRVEGGFPIRSAYEQIAGRVENSIAGSNSRHGAFDTFSADVIFQFLREYSGKSTRPDAELAGDAVGTARDRDYRNLFETLYAGAVALALDKSDAFNPADFLRDIVTLKSRLDQSQRRRESTLIKRDRIEGNLSFTVDKSGNFEEIELRPVPAARVSYDDVIGASWQEVKRKLGPLQRQSSMPHIYTTMTPRGKTKNSVVIVGPPGCGKNFFLRAISADPQIISLFMTTDRVNSIYHSRSESNLRRLMELASELYLEYQRSVGILWDEFESLFQRKPKRGEIQQVTSDAPIRMQKAFQSLLDGDTFYEGVSLCTLTNDPTHIPPEVYRRFGAVVVIQALTTNERQKLLRNLLQGLPLQDRFDELAPWDEFAAMSQFASGEVIGSVFDRIYEDYQVAYERANITGLYDVNLACDRSIEAGEVITQEKRRQIFRENSSTVVEVTPEMFNSAFRHVLTLPEILKAMDHQKRFYDEVDDHLAQAFE